VSVFVRLCVCVSVYLCIYICVSVCAFVIVFKCVCMCVHLCVCSCRGVFSCKLNDLLVDMVSIDKMTSDRMTCGQVSDVLLMVLPLPSSRASPINFYDCKLQQQENK